MKKTVLYILFSTVMFSLMEIVLKSTGDAFNPIQINWIRFTIGGIVLLPFAISSLRIQGIMLRWSDLKLFATTGFMCLLVSMTLFQLAIMYDQASTVAVVFSSNPVFALIFSYIILHERLGRANLIAVILSIIGLLVIVNPTHLNNALGLVLSISSALTFGLYSIISRYGSIKRGFNGIVMTCFTFLVGAIELYVIMLITHISAVADKMKQVSWLRQFSNIPVLTNVNGHFFWTLFFIGVCVTGGGFAFYFLAMERSNVSTASLVFFIKPGLAPILAALLIGDKIAMTTIIGIVIIIAGSVVTFMGNQRRESGGSMQES
ncbi:DMT family transporter [Paucilactobacillus wasatchensis]|uniref:Permease of the drug/metabolite transporter (DMT) superfamily n=1 Tax=Paucilactobacillus wasatchensis TaxID=1335616 RepID=A0A0D0YX15_9LACO|nr:DMT family transporter [Paucilactobacillus wasatchensis]KIS03784.1 Permease of the drug/metabolite transporter (DMT) superfamily [Paucilactobacillus wasatchensis]